MYDIESFTESRFAILIDIEDHIDWLIREIEKTLWFQNVYQFDTVEESILNAIRNGPVDTIVIYIDGVNEKPNDKYDEEEFIDICYEHLDYCNNEPNYHVDTDEHGEIPIIQLTELYHRIS